MNCIRCGRETQENNTFCDACLKEMEKHPVAPGTPIQMPKREKDNKVTARRSGFKMAASKWEDRLYKMKSRVTALILINSLLLLALILCICMMMGIAPSWLYDFFKYTPA